MKPVQMLLETCTNASEQFEKGKSLKNHCQIRAVNNYKRFGEKL